MLNYTKNNNVPQINPIPFKLFDLWLGWALLLFVFSRDRSSEENEASALFLASRSASKEAGHGILRVQYFLLFIIFHCFTVMPALSFVFPGFTRSSRAKSSKVQPFCTRFSGHAINQTWTSQSFPASQVMFPTTWWTRFSQPLRSFLPFT